MIISFLPNTLKLLNSFTSMCALSSFKQKRIFWINLQFLSVVLIEDNIPPKASIVEVWLNKCITVNSPCSVFVKKSFFEYICYFCIISYFFVISAIICIFFQYICYYNAEQISLSFVIKRQTDLFWLVLILKVALWPVALWTSLTLMMIWP